MKYILERKGETQKIEVPDDAVMSITPSQATDGKTELTMYTAAFEVPPGKLIGFFTCLAACYAETMTPKLKTWADED